MNGIKTIMSYNVSTMLIPNFTFIQYTMRISQATCQHVSHNVTKMTTQRRKLSIKQKMISKIPEQNTCDLNIHMFNHAKFQLKSTSLSILNKIRKFIKLGVTQIVTPLFKNSYLINQVSKNYKLYMEITINVSRMITKNFNHFFKCMSIS